jgi:hypothetical protein
MRYRVAKKVFAGCWARAELGIETRKWTTIEKAIARWFRRRRPPKETDTP